ncbi:hypothetical protein NL532_30360 [Mesorhizobium sp. C120A]|uniref:hypothetical protein n=1 Tax=unclassified Mesorhizobium TaxID=325217 RepID=UPI001FD8D8C7|nr:MULTISPECIES: hypothetical protein [unclassified Mesorhizobium]WJI48290.1 hypothetical protein NL532_30360 [Mesorhizobium sp. C120A]
MHSRYQQRLADLPLAEKPVRLVVLVRRFTAKRFCAAGESSPSVLTRGVLGPWARRTACLDEILSIIICLFWAGARQRASPRG